jgi:hypothetical protein
MTFFTLQKVPNIFAISNQNTALSPIFFAQIHIGQSSQKWPGGVAQWT